MIFKADIIYTRHLGHLLDTPERETVQFDAPDTDTAREEAEVFARAGDGQVVSLERVD